MNKQKTLEMGKNKTTRYIGLTSLKRMETRLYHVHHNHLDLYHNHIHQCAYFKILERNACVVTNPQY